MPASSRAGTGRQDRLVTVVIDLTPVRARADPARLLEIVDGRCEQAVMAWLAAQIREFQAACSAACATRPR